jgi:excinuclease ABC subunit C
MCLAPCINKIEKEDYNDIINKITKFYNGDASEVRRELVKKMNKLASELKFEEANECKIMIEYLDHLLVDQNVQLNQKLNADFFSLHSKEGYVSFAVFIYRNGVLVGKESNVYELVGDLKESFEMDFDLDGVLDFDLTEDFEILDMDEVLVFLGLT